MSQSPAPGVTRCMLAAILSISLVSTLRATTIDVTQSPYNADNTGALSALSAIQAAIDNNPSCEIYLPAGVYAIDGQLQLKTTRTMRGDNATLKYTSLNPGTMLVCESGTQVQSLTIDGNNTARVGVDVAYGANGVQISQCRYPRLPWRLRSCQRYRCARMGRFHPRRKLQCHRNQLKNP